jgi:hypothetical protein
MSAFIVCGWMWVTIVNGPIANENITYRDGESCGIKQGRVVRPIDDRVYEYLPGEEGAGTECPDKARFIIEDRADLPHCGTPLGVNE